MRFERMGTGSNPVEGAKFMYNLKCDHSKIYSGLGYLWEWICSQCLVKGIDHKDPMIKPNLSAYITCWIYREYISPLWIERWDI